MRFLAIALLVAVGGCTRGVVEDGAACELNSDCRAPLVCAGAICRPQCRTARDCATGETCASYGADAVCVPPASAVPCVYASDCGGGLVCHDGTCRATCVADHDCAGGTCDAGVCSMPVTTSSGTSDGGVSCPATMCGDRCVDTTSDAEHCGTCDHACAPGSTCTASTCVACPGGGDCLAPNDECLGATPVVFAPGRTVLELNAAAWTDSPGSCATSGDAFYRFHLDVRSIVGVAVDSYFGNAGFVDPSCTTPAARCGDACTVSNSAVVSAVLDPGDHVLVVDGPSTMGADFPVFVDVFPIADVPADLLTFGSSPTTLHGTLGGTTPLPGACSAAGPSHVWYVELCKPLSASTVFTASVCSTAANTVVVSSYATGLATTCTDGAVCASTTMVQPIGVLDGLALLAVEGRSASDTGDVTITGSL